MFQLPPSPPVLLTYALFFVKAIEAVPLIRNGVATASAHRRRCNGIVSAYRGRLKWLRILALFRPRVMILTGLWLALIIIWFILIIFSYHFPDSAVAREIAVTYPYSIWVSLATLIFGFLIIVGTLFSFARIYNFFRFILPQPQGRLASRIDRDDEGYFYVDDKEGETIVAEVISHVLSHPEWYDQADVYTPSEDDAKSIKYANFVFFGELIEARATVGSGLERWDWITSV